MVSTEELDIQPDTAWDCVHAIRYNLSHVLNSIMFYRFNTTFLFLHNTLIYSHIFSVQSLSLERKLAQPCGISFISPLSLFYITLPTQSLGKKYTRLVSPNRAVVSKETRALIKE